MKPVYADMEDDALFEAYHRRGEEGAFAEMMSRHAQPLMRYIRGLLGADSPHADDAFQETWIRVIDNGDKWHGGSLRAWLARIAHNVIVDHFRRTKPTTSLDAEPESGEPLAERMASPELPPDLALAGSETADYIAERVLALPLAQREVFLMRVSEGLSFKEIAEVLKIPLNTALGRMHYAVTRLRADLLANPAEWRRGGRT